MATTKKKKEPSYMNVRINNPNYNRIRDFCKERGYKIGVFMENASVNRMLKEIDTQ
jgi:hypothetical protein